MSSNDGDRENRIRALRELIGGADLRACGAKLGLGVEETRALVARCGWPNKDSMTRSLAVLEGRARAGIEQLLERGERSEMFQTRKLCERIRMLCDDLRDALEKEDATAGLRAEIQELERTLREKRKALGVTGRRASRSKNQERLVTEENRRIKQWGRENGFEVSAQGRVPREVREAWLQSQREENQESGS